VLLSPYHSDTDLLCVDGLSDAASGKEFQKRRTEMTDEVKQENDVPSDVNSADLVLVVIAAFWAVACLVGMAVVYSLAGVLK
jgi:hypothetical protein